jgi:transcriptional repressor NrdR
MNCPFCTHNGTKVIDKRAASDGNINRRRRECLKCSKRFTTYEQIVNMWLTVIKKDGSLQAFDKEKLKNGILKACDKLNIPSEKIDSTVNWIEAKLQARSSPRVKSTLIGELVMKKLKLLDKVACFRFASVYRSLNDIRSIESEIKKIK